MADEKEVPAETPAETPAPDVDRGPYGPLPTQPPGGTPVNV
jgi:hypothetical protein